MRPSPSVLHLKAPTSPFRFEYHPASKKVYCITIGAVPEIGEPIAVDIETEGAAWNATLIYLRGYRKGVALDGFKNRTVAA